MYIIDESLREEFRKVIGKLIRDEKELFEELKDRDIIVSIGDMITYTLLKNGFFPDIAIVDFRHRRKDIDHQMKRIIESFGDEKIHAKNPPSTITTDLIDSIKRAYSVSERKKVLIIVEGEEDLSSLPAILLAPEGVTIIYGLPDKGIVLIDVTEKEKELVRNVLERCRKHGAGDT
ncbi:MAG TPA: DUF359 domain-containing protein [Thermoplasmatales archaeon]|nr:DUF359 domain-containing protein [Thermoplasmatales archaeon]